MKTEEILVSPRRAPNWRQKRLKNPKSQRTSYVPVGDDGESIHFRFFLSEYSTDGHLQ